MPENMIVRAFQAEITRTDARTLQTLLVPYGVPTRVTDLTPEGLDSYMEEIAPSMFAAQTRAAHPQTLARIAFRDQHENGSGKMGWAIALRSDDKALYGSFTIMPSRVADVEAMLDAGITDVSVGFVPLIGGTIYRDDGTRVRTRGHLDHVALEPEGSYPGAQVLALRAKNEADEAEAAVKQQQEQEAAELAQWLAEEEARQAVLNGRLTP